MAWHILKSYEKAISFFAIWLLRYYIRKLDPTQGLNSLPIHKIYKHIV